MQEGRDEKTYLGLMGCCCLTILLAAYGGAVNGEADSFRGWFEEAGDAGRRGWRRRDCFCCW